MVIPHVIWCVMYKWCLARQSPQGLLGPTAIVTCKILGLTSTSQTAQSFFLEICLVIFILEIILIQLQSTVISLDMQPLFYILMVDPHKGYKPFHCICMFLIRLTTSTQLSKESQLDQPRLHLKFCQTDSVKQLSLFIFFNKL